MQREIKREVFTNQHPPVHHPLDDRYYSVVERIIQLCAGEHACGHITKYAKDFNNPKSSFKLIFIHEIAPNEGCMQLCAGEHPCKNITKYAKDCT
jgi:hypothetical protein